MTAMEILNILHRDIHSAVFAAVDGKGLPHTCVIDLMLADEGGLYFLTARGKSFYERLTARLFAALSGIQRNQQGQTVPGYKTSARTGYGTQSALRIFAYCPYVSSREKGPALSSSGRQIGSSHISSLIEIKFTGQRRKQSVSSAEFSANICCRHLVQHIICKIINAFTPFVRRQSLSCNAD